MTRTIRGALETIIVELEAKDIKDAIIKAALAQMSVTGINGEIDNEFDPVVKIDRGFGDAKVIYFKKKG